MQVKFFIDINENERKFFFLASTTLHSPERLFKHSVCKAEHSGAKWTHQIKLLWHFQPKLQRQSRSSSFRLSKNKTKKQSGTHYRAGIFLFPFSVLLGISLFFSGSSFLVSSLLSFFFHRGWHTFESREEQWRSLRRSARHCLYEDFIQGASENWNCRLLQIQTHKPADLHTHTHAL